jgi:hypothetical protein
MRTGRYGRRYRAKGRAEHGVADLPNERRAVNGKGRISCGWFDLSVLDMDALARQQMPRRLGGDWRTGRAPAMRPSKSQNGAGMSLEQGGYGPGHRSYELGRALAIAADEPVSPVIRRGLDAGLEGNPNRGATREKRFGLDEDWVQRLVLEKWEHASVSGKQYFLVCPGCADRSRGGRNDALDLDGGRIRSTVDAKGLKGMTGTTSNCGDGSRGAHGKGWVCGQRVYKLFWVLGRPEEHRDALIAEAWIAGLSSGQLAGASAAVSALVDRYGPIMGDDRLLRCRRCLRLRYGQSPEVLRRKRARRAERD